MKRTLAVLGTLITAGSVTLALAQGPAHGGSPGSAMVPSPGQAAHATSPSQVPPPDDAHRSPADKTRRAEVVATVGSTTITVGDVEDSINNQSPFLRQRYKDPTRLHDLVDNMIRFELLAQEAKRRGYDHNDAVERSIKQNAVQQLIRRQFDERMTPDSVPEADARQYYEEHAKEFHRPAMMRASHILLATRADADKLLAKAKSADARAFRELAHDNSIDTETKLRGGDLRYFDEQGHPPGADDATVDPAIVHAAFQLRHVGDVSDPIQVGQHWSIIQLTGRRPAADRTFDEAEQGIRLRLWRERRQQAIEDFVTSLRKKYHPVVHEERMRPIKLEVAPTAGVQPGFPPVGLPSGMGHAGAALRHGPVSASPHP